MKAAAVVLGLAIFGGLVVLAVAGVSGATAVLVTGAAIVVMIALGNILGGRTTPSRAPQGPGGAAPHPERAEESPGGRRGHEPEGRRGTMGP